MLCLVAVCTLLFLLTSRSMGDSLCLGGICSESDIVSSVFTVLHFFWMFPSGRKSKKCCHRVFFSGVSWLCLGGLVIKRNSEREKNNNGENTNSNRATTSSKKGIVPKHKLLSKKDFLLQNNLWFAINS